MTDIYIPITYFRHMETQCRSFPMPKLVENRVKRRIKKKPEKKKLIRGEKNEQKVLCRIFFLKKLHLTSAVQWHYEYLYEGIFILLGGCFVGYIGEPF